MMTGADFKDLQNFDRYIDRHTGFSEADIKKMLQTLGVSSLSQLIDETVPSAIRFPVDKKINLPEPLSEAAVLQDLTELSEKNSRLKSLIGLGYYGTHTPAVIRRNILENPGWYTAYTPYQPEISQGRLEALFIFQTVITDLTGLEIANASLLDEGSAAAEAVGMAYRLCEAPEGKTVALADDLLPQTKAVIMTRAKALNLKVVSFKAGDPGALQALAPFAVVLQYPGATGEVRSLRAEIAAAHEAGALTVVAADLLALTLLESPGEQGADIVVGSSQRFGVPVGFGGPHAAFLATRDAYKRAMPGRLIGLSTDQAGNPAYRLALQTREQHIRREKATSNVCTAQVLLAVMAGMYAVWHGAEGLAAIAGRVHTGACLLAAALQKAGFALNHPAFFDTISVQTGSEQGDKILAKAREAGFNFFRLSEEAVQLSVDETVTFEELQAVAACFGASLDEKTAASENLPSGLARRSAYLTAEVFKKYRTEHEMMRYLKRLENKDIALNRSMIPLGSCTMKLTAAAAMLSLTLPGFALLHPFVPAEQSTGYQILIDRLSAYLAEITGFPAVSLQPNAGSQGELAGLLAIKAYLQDKGEQNRDICLIPVSAHGTNPAGAVMSGFKTVGIKCDRDGNIDQEDLTQKLAEFSGRIAVLMATYPSTHGVFEENIIQICAAVHQAGGLVYMDGANMNAQLGLTCPALAGADVCHLNLHKTFAIPHGGGGPGVGAIAATRQLADFMPNHVMRPVGGTKSFGAVAAAPFGSALVLQISYAFLRLIGASGLKRISEQAILNANYLAERLEPFYPVVYRGKNKRVAHECIIDCRSFQVKAGVRVEDVAKRLQDFGFHAPTMSWPVAGTLMIEPTESEALSELDRFCEALIKISQEIKAIETGKADRQDNVLKNAPHTAVEVTETNWIHSYLREDAAFPLSFVKENKYWPPVKRVDNAYGDRHLVCTCQ